MYTYHELASKKLATRIIDSAARRTELYYINHEYLNFIVFLIVRAHALHAQGRRHRIL